jgi:hypothetical protein
MGVTNFDSVFASGPVYSQGAPVVPFTTGKVLYVSSTHANKSDNNAGTDSTLPLATVDAAIGKCTASVGDVIVLMPGHAETVTASNIAHDVAGVTIIGLGVGSNRPTFTYGAAAATITVSAANAVWRNCRFIANFVDVAAAFTVGAAVGFTVTDSTFRDTSAILNFLSCVVTGSTNNAADGLTFERNVVNSLAATDGAVVSVLGNLLGLVVSDNNVDKAATNDAGHLITMSSKVVTSARILRNTLVMNALASQSTGTLLTGSSTACSGIVAGNYVYQIDTSTGLLATAGTKMGFIENYMSGAADKSGTLFPAADDPA